MILGVISCNHNPELTGPNFHSPIDEKCPNMVKKAHPCKKQGAILHLGKGQIVSDRCQVTK